MSDDAQTEIMYEILRAIDAGDVDDELDEITAAIKERRSLVTKRAVRRIKVGDEVTFNQQTRPKYLQGVTGTVTKVYQTTVEVRLDQAYGRFPANSPLKVPFELLEIGET